MIRGYLRYRRSMLAAALAAALVFSSVMLLSVLKPLTVAYALLLYWFVLAVFVAFDFPRYHQKIKRLSEIRDNLTTVCHDYPESENNIERIYSEIIAGLFSINETERGKLNSSYTDQIDYYTMWLHQIKNPIAAMRLIIESTGGSPPLEQELFKVERYVEMALDYLKLQNLGDDLLLEPVELDRLLRACVKKYAPLFIYKKLSVNIEQTGLVLTTDRRWLAFIVEQLLSNSAKYTRQGGVKIFLEGRSLVVEDSGIGILPQDLSRVFERGYTGQNGRLDTKASGLGLYLARSTAKKLGLELTAESRVGQGTRMIIGLGGLAAKVTKE